MADVQAGPPKLLAELTAQWDLLAEVRDQQISAGIDISFTHVVAPAALQLLADANLARLADVGCGTGHFATIMAPRAGEVVCIDPSSASLAVARRVCSGASNVRFLSASIEEASDTWSGEPATCAVALMVLMTAPNLSRFAQKLSSVLSPGSAFVAVIPHPFFWPNYWGYAMEPWFDYMKEIFIEAPFKISNARTDFRTTHIHRPLGQYVSCFEENGFSLRVLRELRPTKDIEAMYSSSWAFPRFVALKWSRR